MKNENDFIARKTPDGREQTLVDHSSNVAKLIKIFAAKFGLEETAGIIGEYHDHGKKTRDFINKIESNDNSYVRHSIYGAHFLFGLLKKSPMLAEIIANCITSHHGNLRDFITPDGKTPLYDEMNENLSDMPPAESGDLNIKTCEEEVVNFIKNAPDKWFGMSMMIKILYSCLIDADRLDAFLFESESSYAPEDPDWEALLSKLNNYLVKENPDWGGIDPAIKKLRGDISSQCAISGSRERGIYQLNVPTGGGKTLSGLRFALNHALRHGMNRIIYVIPFLSIIEQTADAIRTALNADEKTVFEHHSDIVPDDPDQYKFHTGRWDAPIIITTQVQFLESIFSSRGSDLRKLHNMAGSVIIFDEAQNIPLKCIHLFNSAVNFLHKACKCTILLCTATQPTLGTVKRKILFSDKPSIAEPKGWPNRVNINYELPAGGRSYPELAEFILNKHNVSTLVILNTKKAVKNLYNELKDTNIPIICMSTNLCKAHRDDRFKEIKKKLANREPVICVTTPLIEAGVDISFECVVREVSGLDSIYQAAGRCNRHGEYNVPKNVYVINLKEDNLQRLPDIRKGAEITYNQSKNGTPEISDYYARFYNNREDEMDYQIKNGGTIYDFLTINKYGQDSKKNAGNNANIKQLSAIRSASEEFYLIAPGQIEIVVPYSNGMKLAEEFLSAKQFDEQRSILHRLGKYSVSIYKYQFDKLDSKRALYPCGKILVLNKGFYDEDLGVDINGDHEFLNA